VLNHVSFFVCVMMCMFVCSAARPGRRRVPSRTNIEEFVPEGEEVDDFLNDANEEEEEEEDDDRWVWQECGLTYRGGLDNRLLLSRYFEVFIQFFFLFFVVF